MFPKNIDVREHHEGENRIKNDITYIDRLYLFSISTHAAETETLWKKMDVSVRSKAEAFTESYFDQKTPDFQRIIDSPSGHTNYLYAEFETGYIIVNITDGFIAEAGEGRIFTEDEEEYIYNGGLEYYRVKDGVAEHLVNGTEIPVDEMVDAPASVEQTAELSVSDAAIIQSVPELPAFIFIDAPIFHYAKTSTYSEYMYCGPLAAANYLAYMDYHYYNSGLLIDEHRTSDGMALMVAIAEIIEYIYGYSVKLWGADYDHMRDGIGVYAYLANKSLMVTGSSTWNTTTYCSKINAGRPVLSGIAGGAPNYPVDHWVTGVGFYISTAWTIDMILFYDEDGLQKTMHPSYFYRMVY